MKKTFAVPLLACALAIPGTIFAQTCEQPAEVQLPDGATASTEQMVDGQRAVKDYIAQGEAFLACMEESEKANGETLSEEQKLENVEIYNSVVDKMQMLAQNFNEQIKAYKAAQAEQ